MKNIWVSSFLAMFSLTMLFGCFGGSVPPPDLSKYTKIALAPLSTESNSSEMSTSLPYDIGTRLDLKFKEGGKIEWIYYKSETIQPVNDKLTELQLTPKQIYVDPSLAAQVSSALGADLIIVGHVSNPRLEEKFDDTPYYDMSQQAGISGTTKYTLLIQSATINVDLKAVDVKTGNVVWKVDNLKGYIKYIKAFQSQIPTSLKSAVEEEIVKADMRRHISQRILHALYPEDFEDREIPDILRKPSLNLVRSGGKPMIY